MRNGLVVGLAFSVSFSAAGCSSSYEPARSPRIVTLVEGGTPKFVRDGERIGSPAFGSGLVDAVHGNPEAERHARIARNLIVGGFVLDIAGLGAEVGGLAVLAHDRNQGHDSPGLGTGLLLGGLAAVIAGSVLIIAGQPHIYDAVNIYNDGVDAAAARAASPALPAPAPAP